MQRTPVILGCLLVFTLAGALLPLTLQADDAAPNLLANGDFETGADGEADHWLLSDGASIQSEDGNRFLRLEARPDKMLTVYRVLPLDNQHKALALRFRVRTHDLKPGKENWHDGRIVIDFKDQANKKINGGPGHPNFKGSSEGWVEKRIAFLVPPGAAKLEIMPAMFRVSNGMMDLDDLTLQAVDPQPILETQSLAAARKAEQEQQRAARVKPQVAPVPQDKLPPPLHVSGNQIVRGDGERVWLQGVSIPSMEWSAGGENVLQSVEEAIRNWNANVIRLPVKEDFWAGKGQWQNDGGAFYRQLVEDVINLASAHGSYVVIDLHRFHAPRQVHADFWHDVATRYRDHPAVLFELFNEPHGISWDVWKEGGLVTAQQRQSDVLAENKQKADSFESIGMQALVNAVRGSDAKNIVIVGGLDWSYDLSGILAGYALDDRGGNGIVYSAHVYPWKSDWQGKFMAVAEKHPIFIGECGAPPERLDFIPPERHEAPSTWVPDFLGLVQQHRYHWTGWSFHPKAAPMMLQDWTYAPTPYWGAPAKAALHGQSFQLIRQR
jgi:endoglucanase